MDNAARSAGQPRKFTEDSLIDLWAEYNDAVRNAGFKRLPTRTNFTQWLLTLDITCTRRTIYNSLEKYFPNVKKEWCDILADTLTEGAAIGKYNPTTVIFCLKNWCAWGDGVQDVNVHSHSEVTASSKLLKALLEDNTSNRD